MFRFSLQRLLEIREKREQATASELADARVNARMARDAFERLEEARRQSGRQMIAAQSSASPVGHLQNASYLLERIDQQLQSARDAMRHADVAVADRMNEFTLACQERKVLDRLRERQETSWQAEAMQADRKTMDAVALSRFGKADHSPIDEKDTR